MTLAQVRQLLDCEVLCGDESLDLDVRTCFAADLMSDVLAFSQPGALLVTGLTSLQSVHTADVADLAAILFVHGKRPADGVVEVARSRNIPILTTRRVLYETCGLLFEHGLKPAARD